jgi:hypothetical protein
MNFVTSDGCGTHLSQEIIYRSHGVVLWPTLAVRMMNKTMDHGATRSRFLAGLTQVLEGIEKLLNDIILDEDDPLMPKLQWVLFSKQHIWVVELYFTMKASVGHLSIALEEADETSEEQMRTCILTASRGLVEFEAKPTIAMPRAQFIHVSVREFLFSGGLAPLDFNLSVNADAISHARLGRWCHAYLETWLLSRHGTTAFGDYSLD